METIVITITDAVAGERLDKVLSAHLPDVSRSRLKALIKERAVSLIGPTSGGTITSPSRSVKSGEVISVTIPDAEDADPEAENIPLDVVYEDSDVILVNKPPGMVVHPAPGSPSGTLVNALLYHCGDSLSGIGGVKRPGIVHRIDKDTSGLIIMAKNDRAHHGLAEQFADHSIARVYHAVCRGHPMPPAGRIEGNIARDSRDRKKMSVTPEGGKWAATHYKTLASYQSAGRAVASLIECQLETGRTHQVRVHMGHIGHTLIGDQTYGRSAKLSNTVAAPLRGAIQSFKRQALHAKTLGFTHPATGRVLKFESDYPYDFKGLIDALEPHRV